MIIAHIYITYSLCMAFPMVRVVLTHFWCICHSIDESMDSHKIKYFAGFYVEFCLALKSKFTVVVISFHVCCCCKIINVWEFLINVYINSLKHHCVYILIFEEINIKNCMMFFFLLLLLLYNMYKKKQWKELI